MREIPVKISLLKLRSTRMYVAMKIYVLPPQKAFSRQKGYEVALDNHILRQLLRKEAAENLNVFSAKKIAGILWGELTSERDFFKLFR